MSAAAAKHNAARVARHTGSILGQDMTLMGEPRGTLPRARRCQVPAAEFDAMIHAGRQDYKSLRDAPREVPGSLPRPYSPAWASEAILQVIGLISGNRTLYTSR